MSAQISPPIPVYDGPLSGARVLVLEDDSQARDALCKVLYACRAEVVAGGLTGASFRVPRQSYDVAVVAAPRGARSIEWLRRHLAPCAILATICVPDPEVTRSAFQAGADDVLVRPADVVAFVRTLEGLVRTTQTRRARLRIPVDRDFRAPVLPFRQPEPIAHLHAARPSAPAAGPSRPELHAQVARIAHKAAISPRERDVLEKVLEGHRNQDIAKALGISVRTVKFHLSNLFEKCGVKGRGGLTGLVWQDGASKFC